MKRTLNTPRFRRLNQGLFVTGIALTGLIVHVRAQGQQQQCINIDDGTGSDDSFNASSSTVAVCIESGAGDDTLTGSSLGDTLDTQFGADTVYGGAGPDEIHDGGGNRGRQYGEDGNDTIHSGNGIDEDVYGGAGNDMLYGEDQLDGVLGRGGQDTIEAGDGNDGAGGDAGEDTIYGGNGADSITGDEDTPGAGADILYDGPRQASGSYAADTSADTFQTGDSIVDEIHAGTNDIVCADDCDEITVYTPGTTLCVFMGTVEAAVAGGHVTEPLSCSQFDICP